MGLMHAVIFNMNNEYINLFKEFLPFFTAKPIQGTPLLKELCKGCLFPFVNITINILQVLIYKGT